MARLRVAETWGNNDSAKLVPSYIGTLLLMVMQILVAWRTHILYIVQGGARVMSRAGNALLYDGCTIQRDATHLPNL
jgi:hypothetical protein